MTIAGGYVMLDCMCRYADCPYRAHFVCTTCRVSFKHHPWTSQRCPHCAGDMINAGRDLHVPRKGDKRGWRVLVALLEAGVRFYSCGCCGPGYRPRTPRELRTLQVTDYDRMRALR